MVESRSILQVLDANHRGNADPKLLAYKYLQMLPEIAEGDANKMWVIPTEFTAALQGISQGFTGGNGNGTPSNSGGDSPGANGSGADADPGTNPSAPLALAAPSAPSAAA